MGLLDGKVAIVTGGGNGLGEDVYKRQGLGHGRARGQPRLSAIPGARIDAVERDHR